MEPSTLMWDPSDQQTWLGLIARSNLPPMVITVAVSGGSQGKEINPNHPETAEEIACHVQDCYKLGATQVHLHVRNPTNLGFTSGDPREYRKVNALIREKCPEIIINNTSGGGMGAEHEEARLASTKANPEVCSLDMGPIASRFTFRKRPAPLSGVREKDIVVDSAVPTTYGETEKFAKIMMDNGIKPEMEVWHTGHYWLVRNLMDKGLVKPPYMIQCVVGFSSGAYSTPKELIHMLECAPKQGVFSVLGVGPMQFPMAVLGTLLGINVRTGMEDNVYINKGKFCKDNAELVDKVVRFAREFGREVATPRQARQMYGLSEKASRYD